MTEDESRLLGHLYHAARGSTHQAMNITQEGAVLGFDAKQTEGLVKSLLDQSYLQPVGGQNCADILVTEVFVTDQTIKEMGAVKTRDGS